MGDVVVHFLPPNVRHERLAEPNVLHEVHLEAIGRKLSGFKLAARHLR